MKKSVHNLIWLVGISGMLLMVPSGQAEKLSQGAMLGISCAGCHGTDGKSPGAIPSIHGKTAVFIKSSLLEFRSGSRASTVMGRHAKGYSDSEIELIAEYFSSIK
jgi:sulfide dehydrogenase cytochrome subunit